MASNADIVRTGYESFIRGDIQTTLAMFAEDIEWHEPEWTYGPASGDFCGRDEVLRRIFAPIPELNDAFALEPREFYCDGDTVIVTGVFHLRPKGSGRAVEVPFAHVWTVHGGRIDSLRAYNDVREIVALHAGSRHLSLLRVRDRPGGQPPEGRGLGTPHRPLTAAGRPPERQR